MSAIIGAPRFTEIPKAEPFREQEPHTGALSEAIRRLSVTAGPISRAQLIPENVFLSTCIRPRTGPAFLEVLPTDICNHACNWCFTEARRVARTISALDLRHSLERFVEHGGTAVLFSGGGEPLAFPALTKRVDAFEGESMVDWLARRGVTVAVITNGVLLDHFLHAHPRFSAAVAFIRVSLDATTATDHARLHEGAPGDFNRIQRAIRTAVASRGPSPTPAVGLSFVVDVERGLNCGRRHLEAINSIAGELGVDFVQLKHRHTTSGVAADRAMVECGDVLQTLAPHHHQWWVHRFTSPRPSIACTIPTAAQVLRSDSLLAPCCHLQHIALPAVSNRALPLFVVDGCPSPACRYASANDILTECSRDPVAYAGALSRLKQSLEVHGFHPYRLFPSAPTLTSEPTYP